MTIFTVANATELAKALSSAKGGDSIQLKSGHYGNFNISGKAFASNVTITAADPKNPPVFNQVALIKSSNITFDNIKFNFQPTSTTVEWDNALRVDGSSNIKVVNSVFTGGNAVAGIDPNAPAGSQGSSGILGWPIGRAMSFLNSQNITIDNNKVTGFSASVRFSNVDTISMNNNDMSGFRKVPVGGGDVNNVTMTGNYFHDPKPWSFGGVGDHGDFIHFWTTTTQTGASQNFVIKNNYLDQGNGTAVLGIYFDDNTNMKGFQNVLIEGNVIHNSNNQALRMEDVVGLIVRSNTIVASSKDPSVIPQIYLADGTKNVVIDDNIMGIVAGPAAANLTGNGIKILANFYAQMQNSQGADYVGNIFLDALGASPSLSGFIPLPGSAAAGFGANVPAPTGVWGYIGAKNGTGQDIDNYTFDASNIFAATSKVNLSGATVVWTLSDGTVLKGTSVTHEFSTYGAQTVKAVVTLANGTKLNLTKTLTVLSPAPISENFDDQLHQNAAAIGTVKFEGDGKGGSAVRLVGSGSAVKYNYSSEIAKNSEFSISFDFKKDAAATAAGGRVLYFSGTAVVDVGADSVTLRGKTSAGEAITLTAKGIGVQNANWHTITYSFSQKDGRAILYIDGKEVDRVEGLTGAQYVTGSHGMHLGNPYGSNFAGLLDNVKFTYGAAASTGSGTGTTSTASSTTTTAVASKTAVVAMDTATTVVAVSGDTLDVQTSTASTTTEKATTDTSPITVSLGSDSLSILDGPTETNDGASATGDDGDAPIIVADGDDAPVPGGDDAPVGDDTPVSDDDAPHTGDAFGFIDGYAINNFLI